MLSIGKLGTGQERYYLEKVAEGAEDYYSGKGEIAGQWMGDGAAELGLSGKVEADQLTAMLTGRNPVDGSPLGLRAVGGRGPVPGFDLTFSAPKSVSLLWGLGGPLAGFEVNAAHRDAVDAALGYLQREACWTRRGAGGAEFVKGSGYLAAAFEHRSSRNGDPQLHTHVLIANATQGPDGRWTRLYHPAVYEQAQTASYLYQAHLRHELTRRLGVEWQEVRKGIAEVEGFAEEHLREFSTRRAEILEAAGPDASARSMEVAALATRQAKERDVSRRELYERWRSRGEEIGLDRETIERTFDQEVARSVPLDLPAVPRTVSFEQVDRAVTAHASHFDRRDAIQAVAESFREGAPATEVERLADEILASETVISLGATPKGERYTTARVWAIEQRALEASQRLASVKDRACLDELAVERVLAGEPKLKADQRQMVRGLLGDGAGLSVVVGEAGTGKSYALRVAAAAGWAQARVSLRTAAPTWRAADVLCAEGLKATSVASTLARMDAAEQKGERPMPPGSVLLVDEASMLDSATLARLVDHTERAEAKLVLIGDPQQLGEIEAGGLFAMLVDSSEPYVLDEVIRHTYDVDREAAKLIREGKGAEAIDLYRSSNRIVVAPNADTRREAMVADWWRSFSEGDDALMVVKRNAEVAELNARARETMREHGRLGETEIQVGDACFAVGDRIITRVNDHANQIYNRQRWRIAEVDAEQRKVLLEAIDHERTVELDAAYLARTNPYNDAPALEHGYAATTYCAQGATVDRAFLAVDPSMDKQELYVAASRSREETYLYATPEIDAEREEYAPCSPNLREGLDHIAEAAQRDRAQIAAHEAARHHELSQLDNAELLARRSELEPAVREESRLAQDHRYFAEQIERVRGGFESSVAERERIEGMRRRERRPLLPQAQRQEESWRSSLARAEQDKRELDPPREVATREAMAIDAVLAGRRQLALTAARISPPVYVIKELGERPMEPELRREWDRGVERIERYRQEHGIRDKEHAFGKSEPKDRFQRIGREAAQEELRRTQRRLGLDRGTERSHDLGQERGGGREVGI
ncbi:MAG TPA: MobF family relaxase [Solirubrobacterales bacterium]|nr:MobF family relaxase [Solirubrobacterales bacterium]